MPNRFRFIILIIIPIIIFGMLVLYWTVLPRQGTIEILGEGVYAGQLKGMIFHGYGTYESYTVGGTSYEGEWKDGAYHGQGTLTFANGSKIVGQFKNGSLYGEGVTICADGHERTVDFGEPVHSDVCSGCGHDHSECDHDH